MESKFSIVITIDGAISTSKIVAELRRYADGLEGNHYPAGTKPPALASAPATPKAETPKDEVPPAAAKPKPAKSKPAPKAEELEEAISDEAGDDLGLGDDDDLGLDGEPELTLSEHVLPAFKARLTERQKAVGPEKARAEIAALMKTKFGVASGKVTELPSKHFKAALEAIK